MKRNLEIGGKINNWTVISKPFYEDDKEYYKIQCICNKIEKRSRRSLERPNFSKACRRCSQLERRKNDRTYKIGMKIMNLEILNISSKNSKHNTLYKVKCNCGHTYWTGHPTLSRKASGKGLPYCNNCFNYSDKAPKKNTMLSKDISMTIYKRLEREAKRKGIIFNISVKYLQELYDLQNHKCRYSGIELNITESISTKENRKLNTASLDRIDSSKGYIEGNVQWIHKDINYMKFNFSEEKFLNLCKMITNNNANFEPSSSKSKNKVDEKVQRLDVEELDTNNTSTSVQQPKIYYVESNFGYGDSARIAENLNEKEALKIFNKEINGDFTSFKKAFEYDHPIYEIREMGY